MSANSAGRIRFGTFEADLSVGELRNSGRPVRLQEQPFRVLKALLDRPGEIVTREEFRKQIWGDDVYVDFERSLTTAVARLREALGDSPNRPKYIETVPRRGYRFIAPLAAPLPDDWKALDPSVLAKPDPPKRYSLSWRLGAILAGIFAAITIVVLWFGRSPVPTADSRLAAMPLTYYEGVENEANFSPDGSQITFTWNGVNQDNFDVYVQTVGGAQPLRLTDHANRDFSPAWSPNGRWIAFLRERGDGRADVYRIPPFGGREERLSDIAAPSLRLGGSVSIHDRYLCWSPDSEFLVVVDQEPTREASSLFLFSPNSGSKRKLTDAPKGSFGDRNPTFSPDGRRLAFNGSRGEGLGVFVLPLDIDLSPAGDPEFIVRQNSMFRGMTWTPEGSELLVYTEGRLWRVAVDRSQPMRRLDFAGPRADLPSVSPAGNRLIFTQRVYDINIWQIALSADLVGTAPRKVISSTGFNANLDNSPDGKQVVFMSNRTGETSIWIGNTDGGQQAPLFARQGGTPRWSPNGGAVVFDSPSGQGDYDIWTISSQAGVARQFTQGRDDDRSPNWSRDGNWIYFASDRGDGFQLWKKSVNSGEERQVTRYGGFYSDESIDGRYVYYTKGRGDWTVWKVPAGGGPEEQVLESVSSWNNFEVTERGIYHTPKRGPDGMSAILFYDFSDESISAVFEPERPISNGLSVAPDGRSLLYSQIDREGSDLMLVEDFR